MITLINLKNGDTIKVDEYNMRTMPAPEGYVIADSLTVFQ
jgi:hypothetical protein